MVLPGTKTVGDIVRHALQNDSSNFRNPDFRKAWNDADVKIEPGIQTVDLDGDKIRDDYIIPVQLVNLPHKVSHRGILVLSNNGGSASYALFSVTGEVITDYHGWTKTMSKDDALFVAGELNANPLEEVLFLKGDEGRGLMLGASEIAKQLIPLPKDLE